MGRSGITEADRPSGVDAENAGCPSGCWGTARARVLALGAPGSIPGSVGRPSSGPRDPKRKLFPPILKFVPIAVWDGADRAAFAPGLPEFLLS